MKYDMFRRLWQSLFIHLARSQGLTRLMQGMRSTSRMSRQYVGGASPEDGVARAETLMKTGGIGASLFYLGEYVETPEGVAENLRNKLAAADALAASALEVHISVDPTQIGHVISPELAEKNAVAIARRIRSHIAGRSGFNGLMLDMEDASLNDPTIGLHNRLRGNGLPAALTLQAYLRRTEADLRAQIEHGSKVRLVKGAFAASADIAFTNRRQIKDNYRKLISLMLSNEARQSGFYPVIATHDTGLHAHALAEAARNGWKPGEYEFEMLLGVRANVAKALAAQGERVRLYLPFGKDWWPYAIRRIGENPANAALLGRSLFS